MENNKKLLYGILFVAGLAAPAVVYPIFLMKALCFALFASAFNLLLGYTGLLSFGHAMFLGTAGYVCGHAVKVWGFPTEVGILAGVAASAGLGYLVGSLAIRRQGIYFAMITLAFSQMLYFIYLQAPFTGGEDGLNYRLPAELRASFSLGDTLFGVRLNGRLLDYYLVYFASLALVLALLRIVNSPFGSVLKAIRENPFRAEAIGYRTVVYRTIASCIAAAAAALAGVLLALWSSQTNPDTTLSFDIMVDILLMVVIGGMGTMYGAVIGAVLLVFAQNYLQDLLAVAHKALTGVPLLANLFHPDRWLLWLGVAFILCVYFFPTGIVGRLRNRR